MPTEADLATIRAWCGSHVGTSDHPTFPPDDLDARLDRLHSAEAVALEVLRQQRADLIAAPAQFQLDGDYSQNTAANLEQIDADIKRLERIVGGRGASTVTVTRLRRTGPRR